MKKVVGFSVILTLSVFVFTGCTKATGDSVSSINPSINVQTTQTVPAEAQMPAVPALENGSEITDLEADLNQTDFNDIDIEIDSSL